MQSMIFVHLNRENLPLCGTSPVRFVDVVSESGSLDRVTVQPLSKLETADILYEVITYNGVSKKRMVVPIVIVSSPYLDSDS